MNYTVKVGEETDYSLVENDMHRSVLQDLAVLFATKKGTVPMYREFGLDMKFIDMPMNAAKTVLMAEVIEAVGKYEPRAQIVSVSFEPDTVTGTATPRVEVKIIEQEPRI